MALMFLLTQDLSIDDETIAKYAYNSFNSCSLKVTCFNPKPTRQFPPFCCFIAVISCAYVAMFSFSVVEHWVLLLMLSTKTLYSCSCILYEVAASIASRYGKIILFISFG